MSEENTNINNDEVLEPSVDTTKEDNITSDDLANMSDSQFEEYLQSGKIPSTNNTDVPDVSDEENKDKEDEEDKKTVSEKEDDETEVTVEDTNDVDNNEEQKNDSSSTDSSSTIDYKAAYETIFKPFKANGKEITPRNVDDVINLMQMGANYTKKMQVIAPMKKVIESLNKAEIDEKNLNFLIDVYKGDKEAIKKLLKKHSVDPIELDLDETNYVPKNNIVSDEDVEFSNVLDDIRDSLPKIQDIINSKWDKNSKDKLLSDPKLLRALHEEIQYGRFDKIQAQVEMEKMFGRYRGVSDLDAYIDIVTKAVQKESQQHQPEPKVETKPEPKVTHKIPDKTKAAPTKTKSTTKSSLTAKDILSMSEEDFNKLNIDDLYS